MGRLEGKIAVIAGARLSQPCLPESRPGVSATLTTFDDSSLRWLEINT
jgi:hypothetical protein